MSGETNHCLICGCELRDWRTCEGDEADMDCGGHCLACVQDSIGPRMTASLPRINPHHHDDPGAAYSENAQRGLPVIDPPEPRSDQQPGFKDQVSPEAHRVRRSANMRSTG